MRLISVIIPCRNGANYLAEAVAGIRGQNMPVEIIVVDDGSADATAELAESLGCRVIRHGATRGQVAGKNTGLRAARGEYVMFHDHDDIMNDGALAALRQELDADEALSLVMARVMDFFSPEMPEEERRKIKSRGRPYHGLFTGATLMRRCLFDAVGPFDEKFEAGEIIHLFRLMDELGLRRKKIDFTAAKRRIHADNYSRTNAESAHRDHAAVLRETLRSRALFSPQKFY
jgi:glycosyltransferase involved in cell wall biosynthesis